jgi:hypothetical protein
MMLCVLLPTCYVADYLRRNLLPTWYVALRLPLTVLATWGMLLTATRYLHAELDKIDNIKQQQQQGAAEQA